MKQTGIVKSLLSILITGALFLYACSKNKIPDDTDARLYKMAKETNGFTWYLHVDSLFERSSGSGHAQPYLKTRYNSIAAAYLDSNGKVIPGTVFPEGALIVKELYSDSTTIGRYAVLFKESSNPNADANGWIWGYINADGTVASPAKDKGGTCISCHSQTENIDYMLMNKYFP